MFGKRSLSLKFSAGLKLGVNSLTKISGLSLSDRHRQFSIQSFLWGRRGQSGSRRQRLWSLFKPQARDLFDKYRISFMEESSTVCLGFKLRFSETSTKDFKSLSCCLMINLTEIQEHLETFGPPNARGPCHMARMPPPLKGPAHCCPSRDRLNVLCINVFMHEQHWSKTATRQHH